MTGSASLRRERGGRLDPRSAVSLVVVAVLSGLATFGLRSVTDDWSFVVPAAAGAVGATVVLGTARRLGLLFGEALAVSVAGFTVVGALVVGGGLPTLSAFGGVFRGVTRAWSEILAATPPVELTPELRMAPFALAWVAATTGVSLMHWRRPPGLPVLGPLVALVVTVLLTQEDRSMSLLLGTVMALGAIGLSLLRRPTDGAPANLELTGGATSSTHRRRHRLVRTAVALAVVGTMAPLVGPRLPLADANDRFDLRDRLVAPWDPLSVPSPLVQIKASLTAEREDEVVFTFESEEPITRWNLAVMGAYDGVVWTVASPDEQVDREFRPVGSRLPPSPDDPSDRSRVAASVTLVDVPGPWLPTPGWPTELEIDDVDAGRGVRANVRTGTMAVPDGLPAGSTYAVEALEPPVPSTEELLAATVPELGSSLDLEVLPPQIRNLTADITQGIDRGWGQVDAIRDRFTINGFYDRSPSAAPGHSFFRLATFLADPDQVIGYEEQYAAAAAVMTRVIGLPSRVVVGYVVPEDRHGAGPTEVLAGDVAAWIEVLTDEVGWVPVDVTPPRTREPEAEAAIPPREQVATPNPPPPPRPPPPVEVVTDNRDVEDLVDEDEDDDEDEEEPESLTVAGGGWLPWVLLGVGGLGGVLALVAALILAAKLTLTRRRRTAPSPPGRVAGAWHEFTDRCREAGLPRPRHTTPSEIASLVQAADPATRAASADLIGLVQRVDRSAFHAHPPGPDEADRAWQHYDAVHLALMNGRSRWDRARMRLDPRPLLRRAAAGD